MEPNRGLAYRPNALLLGQTGSQCVCVCVLIPAQNHFVHVQSVFSYVLFSGTPLLHILAIFVLFNRMCMFHPVGVCCVLACLRGNKFHLKDYDHAAATDYLELFVPRMARVMLSLTLTSTLPSPSASFEHEPGCLVLLPCAL